MKLELNSILQKLLYELEDAVKDIEKMGERISKSEDILKDTLILRAIRDATFVAIQSCIDIGNRIISVKGWRKPESYRDIFQILEENGVILKELSEKLKDFAGLRNALIHLYWQFQLERLYKFIKEEYKTIEVFKKEILKFLVEREKDKKVDKN